MKKNVLIVSLITVTLFLGACSANKSGTADIPTDSTSIASGKLIFSENCSACHDFERDGIGPQLGGITAKASPDWIRNFVKDPQAKIESEDERSQKLFARYKTVMPAFSHFTEDEMTELLAYLHSQKAPDTTRFGTGGLIPVKDPIPQPIAQSDLVVGVALVTQTPQTADEGTRTRITKLSFIPGTDRLFIVDIRGKLYELRNGIPAEYMDMGRLKPNFIDKPGLATGFGSFAFHPDFLKNGLLYTGHTEKAGSGKADFAFADSIGVAMQWVISEWKTDHPESFPFQGKSRELFRINMVSGAHGVQEFAFDPNATPGDETYGLLYIGIGDGTSVQHGHYQLVGSNENALGSIFRIDPLGSNSANGQYGIPPSNPFAGNENPRVVKEIYAYGFRNPHRLSWTRSGQLLASNIGQTNIESINLILPGHNYGWPYREGTFLFNPSGDLNYVYPLPADEDEYQYTYPIAQYDHDEGNAVIGGFEYKGSLVPELNGKYLFADMNNGRLYYIDVAEIKPGNRAVIKEWHITLNGKPTTTSALCGNKRVDLRLGQDHQGEIYFFSKQDGKVYKLVSAQNRVALR